MKFSIITAAYNSEKTISRAIESVVNQDYPNLEYIIIDGASTDKTIDIIKKYKEKYPEKIKWISEPDNGVYDAINKGLDLADGRIIGILGGDDWYLPNIFEKIVPYFPENGDMFVVYGLVNVFINDTHIMTEGIHHNNLSHAPLSHQSCFISKKIHEKYGKYDTRYKIGADYDFFLKISKKNDITFKNLNIPLANYNGGGLSSDNKARYFEFLKIRLANNIISKKEYTKQIFRLKIKFILKKLLRYI
jgi:glycosyltransferase involved in cell wall biosynthesis